MRNNYKDIAIAGSLLLASFIGFAQESPEKPIKKLKVFNQTENKALGNSQQVLSQQLRLPEGNSLSKISEKVDELGFIHREYQQYYNNVKVAFS